MQFLRCPSFFLCVLSGPFASFAVKAFHSLLPFLGRRLPTKRALTDTLFPHEPFFPGGETMTWPMITTFLLFNILLGVSQSQTTSPSAKPRSLLLVVNQGDQSMSL